MKIAYIIGHHEKSQGANSPYLDVTEWQFYREVEDYYKNQWGKSDFYTHDPNIKGYTKRVKNTCDKVNKKDYDLVIALHFNSVANPDAKGCETLYNHRSVFGHEYAKKFSKLINDKTGISLRGADGTKSRRDGDRGFGELSLTKAPTILIEPFFGSNENDCEKIGGWAAVEVIASLLIEFERNV